MTRIAIIGGGPGGYEAALVAAQLGGQVTVVEETGIGGAAVLTDCVPSKALIATAEAMTGFADGSDLGITGLDSLSVNIAQINSRILALAAAQSNDISQGLLANGVTVINGRAVLKSPHEVEVDGRSIPADIVLIATGASPRTLPEAQPDGERILTWKEIYSLNELPEHLIVIGSGVTGAEFASGYLALGSRVTLVSSRDRVLPGEDADAAAVIEEVFSRRGGVVQARSRAKAARRTSRGVEVELTSGEIIEGSHVLLAVGSTPNTAGLGLEEIGVALDSGYVKVDELSRTNVSGIYAAGDCTGVLPLASVAAMQGRIAMWHSLANSDQPLRRNTISSTVFTEPEIATVGMSQTEADEKKYKILMLPLDTNARAKMANITDGFIKIISDPNSVVVGGVICTPRASELIFPLSMAVSAGLTVDQVAQAFTVYPSLTGSIAEAARRLRNA